MIYKIGQPLEWRRFKSLVPYVGAVRMIEDSLYETKGDGWRKIKKGQWLVQLSEGALVHCDDESFKRCYKEPTNGRKASQR